MPRVDRVYRGHRFAQETVASAYELFKRYVSGLVPEVRTCWIEHRNERRTYPEAKDFMQDRRHEYDRARLEVVYKTASFLFDETATETLLEVGLPDEASAQAVVQLLDGAFEGDGVRRSIFLGHGRDPAWRKLSDHLAAQPDLRIHTYENSIRAGVTAIELLEELSERVQFAVLVHTCDDGARYPSDNVVHETGFFQGALGRHQTLVVRQRGCEGFHNIAGLHEVAFELDSIKDAFADVTRFIREALRRHPS